MSRFDGCSAECFPALQQTGALPQELGIQRCVEPVGQRHSDEQLRLSNEHIRELAEVRQTLEEQRRISVDAASAGTRLETLKEEFRRERDALEARYQEEISALKNASEHWEEQRQIA